MSFLLFESNCFLIDFVIIPSKSFEILQNLKNFKKFRKTPRQYIYIYIIVCGIIVFCRFRTYLFFGG